LLLADGLGPKRGRGPGTFVGDARSQMHGFYREVLQRVRPWQAPAPRLPDVSGTQEPPIVDEIPVGETVAQGADAQPI
jgi:hypothetical protein